MIMLLIINTDTRTNQILKMYIIEPIGSLTRKKPQITTPKKKQTLFAK